MHSMSASQCVNGLFASCSKNPLSLSFVVHRRAPSIQSILFAFLLDSNKLQQSMTQFLWILRSMSFCGFRLNFCHIMQDISGSKPRYLWSHYFLHLVMCLKCFFQFCIRLSSIAKSCRIYACNKYILLLLHTNRLEWIY